MVPMDGLEPSLPKKPDFESSVSTNSTTSAQGEPPRREDAIIHITALGLQQRQQGSYCLNARTLA